MIKERDDIQKTLTNVESSVAKVYCHVTNGQISKCNIAPGVVIAVTDDCLDTLCLFVWWFTAYINKDYLL